MSMILYNYRYHGPYEYDKFVNNTLQFFNETRFLENKLLSKDYSELQKYLTNMDILIDSLTGENCHLQQQLMISEQVGG